jgi:hypothetical protein
LFQPTFLDRAGCWFLSSGIQDDHGGVARYYRSDIRQNLPVSSEITGYAASTLVYLYSLTRLEEYLDRAVMTARYLTRRAWRPALEAFPFEPDVSREQFNYFFDAGIIVRGLLAVWRATGEHEFLDVAATCGRAMVRDFWNSADIHPILTLPDKSPIARDDRWSRNPGCYQLKSALAWNELAAVTRDGSLRAPYERALAYSLATYGSFLPGHQDRLKVMDRLHAYLYFLEGLLPVIDRKPCSVALCDGIRRVSLYLREIRPEFERSDVYAQLLRARLLADLAGVSPLDEAAAEEEAAILAAYQNGNGAFGFGRKAGEDLPFENPVSTGFGIQALAMWEQRRTGDLRAKTLDSHRLSLI